MWGIFRLLVDHLGLKEPSLLKLRNLDRIVFYQTRFLKNNLAISKLPDGSVVVHPVDSLNILDEVYFYRIYDRLRNIGNNDVVIDCGAHIGIFTLKAAKRARQGIVIAIEPHPFNCHLLELNVRLNALTNVIIVNSALAQKNGESGKLYLGPSSEAHSIRLKRSSDFIGVTTITLDSLVERFAFESVDYIKMDVEGSELEAIEGGKKILKNTKYLVIGEIHISQDEKQIKKFLMSTMKGRSILRMGRQIYVI